MNEKKSFLKEVGLKIKHIRQEKKISQQDLAALCNFEKSNMCRIEAGNSNLTLTTLHTIAKALRVPPNELITVENNSEK